MLQAYGIYDENVLLDRLFGGYRLTYNGNTTGKGCSFDDEVGKKLFEVNPSEVPSEEYFPLCPDACHRFCPRLPTERVIW